VKVEPVFSRERTLHTFCRLVSLSATLQLQWRHVAASDLSQTLILDDQVAYYDLAFGISTERTMLAGDDPLITSSGITWADCVYLAHAGTRYPL